MRSVMVILKHNLKSIMKGWFWLILVLPIAMNLVVSVLINKINDSSGGGTYHSVVIYSKDNSDIIDKLLPKEKFSNRIMVSSEKELKEVLDNEKSYTGVIFNSKDIYNDIKNNKKGLVEIVYNSKESNKEYVFSILNNSITQISSLGDDKEEFSKLYNQYEKEKYEFKYDSKKLGDTLIYIIMFGIFSMVFLFIAGRCISPILKERELKIDRRILASKISKIQYNLGHILGCFILLLLQSITLVITFLLLNKSFEISFEWMILLSFVLSFVGVAVALIVLSISSNSTMYYTLLSIIVTPMALLSGGFLPTEFMPKMVQNISLIFPLTWVNSAFKKILMNGSYSSIGMDLFAAISISIVLIMLYLVIENNKKVNKI